MVTVLSCEHLVVSVRCEESVRWEESMWWEESVRWEASVRSISKDMPVCEEVSLRYQLHDKYFA